MRKWIEDEEGTMTHQRRLAIPLGMSLSAGQPLLAVFTGNAGVVEGLGWAFY